jgi:hypothetical protein
VVMGMSGAAVPVVAVVVTAGVTAVIVVMAHRAISSLSC